MELTAEDEKIAAGDWGEMPQQLMTWMIKFGDAMGASRFVPVDNVLMSGISAPANWSAGEAERTRTQSQIDLLMKHRMKTFATTHVARLDIESPQRRGHADDAVAYQKGLIDQSRDAGIIPTWTCAPYLVGNSPIMGEICAWTESSAVVYANTFLGARTNRNGAESAFAAAVLGRVPEFGLLTDEGRRGDLIIDVGADLSTPADWGALGYFAGSIAGLRVPVFIGTGRPSQEGAKQLSAALATSGGVSMAHVVGVTPEAFTLEQAFGGHGPSDSTERHAFGTNELASTYAQLRDYEAGTPIDYVVVGCPHASIREIFEVVAELGDQSFAHEVTFVINAAYPVYAAAQRLGYVDVIEKAGGEFIVDSCPAVVRWKGGNRLVTNSFKQAHYQRGIFGISAAVGVDVVDCVRSAITGRWEA